MVEDDLFVKRAPRLTRNPCAGNGLVTPCS